MKKKKEEQMLKKVNKRLYILYKFYAKRNEVLTTKRMDIDKQIVRISLTYGVLERELDITFLCLTSNKITKIAKIIGFCLWGVHKK